MTARREFLSLLTGCFATPAAESPTVAMLEAVVSRLLQFRVPGASTSSAAFSAAGVVVPV